MSDNFRSFLNAGKPPQIPYNYRYKMLPKAITTEQLKWQECIINNLVPSVLSEIMGIVG